ncbi:MAG: hypothetical protein NT076_03865 [Candidatus Pacearchaeota archaeon]|nr:hypothetical protein [Candidatus Pacearchaeota archaeon]
MPYKCLKCGSEETEVLVPKRFEAEAVFYPDEKGKIDDSNIAFGTKVEDVGRLLCCKKCDNSGSLTDRSKFSVVPDNA